MRENQVSYENTILVSLVPITLLKDVLVKLKSSLSHPFKCLRGTTEKNAYQLL